MSPELFFLVAAVCAVHAALASTRARYPFTMAWFLAGWLTGELALVHLAWQVAITLAAVATGALDGAAGWWGLALMVASWIGLLLAHRRAGEAEAVVHRALGDHQAEAAEPDGELEVVRDLSYGPHGRANTLDLHRSRTRPERSPVVVQIHGGTWMHGRKERQARPLIRHLAARGWVVAAVNYRLSPAATFPDHLEDVRRAVAWLRTHADEHGLDPGFIVVTGGSAGAHLAALAALDPATGVQGCVALYGIYDLLDRAGARGRATIRPLLERVVLKCSPEQHPERWEAASPIAQVGPHAPPFLVVHGTLDSMAFVGDARAFVGALRAAATEPVVYAELPGAQHAFDTFPSVRANHVVRGVARWLSWLRSRHLAGVGQADHRL